MIDRLSSLSASDVIMMLHELHQRGYEQLRLFSCMSNTGLCWRYHIYPKVVIAKDWECERKYGPIFCENSVFYGSASTDRPEQDISILADKFIESLPDLVSMAKAPDPEYIRWFDNIVSHAQDLDFPLGCGEYWNHKEWAFTSGRDELSFPPIPVIDWHDISDEKIIEYVPLLFDEFSASELKYLLESDYRKPPISEIAEVVRTALRQNIGLINHEDEGLIELFAWKHED